MGKCRKPQRRPTLHGSTSLSVLQYLTLAICTTRIWQRLGQSCRARPQTHYTASYPTRPHSGGVIPHASWSWATPQLPTTATARSTENHAQKLAQNRLQCHHSTASTPTAKERSSYVCTALNFDLCLEKGTARLRGDGNRATVESRGKRNSIPGTSHRLWR